MSKPLFATDVILFSIINNKLNVLIIQRDSKVRSPNKWALPGGVIDFNQNETSEIKALSVLQDRLGLKSNIYLEQFKLYDKIDRDPDEYSISISYISLVDKDGLNLINGNGVQDYKWVEVDSVPELAFDHNQMILDAVIELRKKLRRSSIGFQFLPKEFTIPELRNTYESLLSVAINPSNFRTKLIKMGILECLGKKNKDAKKGQPPTVYKLREDVLEKVINTEQLFHEEGE